jgi:hypothetical protein
MIKGNAYLLKTAATLLIFAQLGCTVTTALSSPQPYFETHRPIRATIRTRDGKGFVMLSPTVRGDTILGFDKDRRPVSLPLSEVREILATESDVRQTVIGVISLGILAAIIVPVVVRRLLEPPESK